MSSVTAVVVRGGKTPEAPAPEKLPPFETLMKAFPPTRLTVERGTWAQRIFLFLWLPFGVLVLLPIRAVTLFVTLALHMADIVGGRPGALEAAYLRPARHPAPAFF